MVTTNKTGLIWINGKTYDRRNAKISVFDRGFLYGDSIYEVTRSYDGTLMFLDEHLDRLYHSAKLLWLSMDLSKEKLKTTIEENFKKFNCSNCYLRIVITRGEGAITLDPSSELKNNIVLIFKPHENYPADWYDIGVDLVVSGVIRNPKESVDPNAKSGNYLNNIMAMMEAKKRGAFDAIMVNKEGLITEGTTNNIWMVKDQKVITPPLKDGILKGITREKLFEAMKEHHFDYQEKSFTPSELFQADEAFITSSTKEVVPVVTIDKNKVGDGIPGPLTKKIHTLYKNLIKTEQKKRGSSL
jgi:branched-chain amino acid aminotransferase